MSVKNQEKILEVKNITKIYKIYNSNFHRLKELFSKKIYHKEFVSNKNISFDLNTGESLGILGVNGAGKSTILKIITGVVEASCGEVIKKGRITALLELGTGFNPLMNGYDNIFLNGALIGMSKKEIVSQIDNIIEFSELGDYIYEPIKTYSSGMNMRLAFSIAIFSNPQVLIVDEALSVGDAHFAAKCTKALQKHKEQNMSIIYVSHDLNSLKLLCDRLILLNKGEIIEQGDPEDVINHYNFLISKLDNTNEKIVFKSEDKSFGNLDVQITKVTINGIKSNADVLSSGEDGIIKVHITSTKNLDNMTIGIMIRDKFGQDIFGTNTFYHNIDILLKDGFTYVCEFKTKFNIGVGKYSITAAIHSKDTHLENCEHWLDNATNFEIIQNNDNYFVGLCKLNTKISFNKEKNV